MDANAYWKAIAIEYYRANQGFLTTGEKCYIILTFQLFKHKRSLLIAESLNLCSRTRGKLQHYGAQKVVSPPSCEPLIFSE